MTDDDIRTLFERAEAADSWNRTVPVVAADLLALCDAALRARALACALEWETAGESA